MNSNFEANMDRLLGLVGVIPGENVNAPAREHLCWIAAVLSNPVAQKANARR